MKERRKHPRFRMNMTLRYRCVDENNMPSEAVYSSGRVIDISDGGMLIEVDRGLDLGQKLEVYTSTKSSSSGVYGIVVAVRVVRAIELFEIGVKFETREKL